MRNLIKVIFACSIIAFFLVQIVGASTSTTWWNSSWAYKKPIEVNTLYNYTDYQLKLNLTDEVNSTQGAVGIWRFLEGSGTKTADASGNYNDGTLVNGPIWTNTGLDFDGINDYVNVGSDQSIEIGTGPGTLRVWFKVEGGTGTTRVMYGSNWAASTALQIRVLNTDVLQFLAKVSGVGCGLTGSSNVSDGNWHYAVGVIDVDNSECRLYLDGELEVNDTYTTVNLVSSVPYLIGALRGTVAPYLFFNGIIEEFHIYKRVLTESEINKTYCEGAYRLNKTSTFDYPSWCEDYLDTNIKKSYALYFRDLRFTNSDEDAELSYFQDLHHENVFYVEGNFTNTNGTQMYMYYGNDNVNTTSSYYDTFNEDNNNIVLDIPMKYQFGTNAWDVSGEGNNGTLINGPVWISDGLSFDGSNDYVNIPNDNSLNFGTSPFSILVYFKKNGADGGAYDVLQKRARLGTSSAYPGYAVFINSNDLFYLRVGPNDHYDAISQSLIQQGSWYHTVAVRNGSDGYVYINGVDDTDTTKDMSGNQDNTYSLEIGRDRYLGYYFNGIISYVRIYNTSLSTNEISLLYNETEYPPTYSIGPEQPRTSYLKLTTDKTNYQLGEVVHLTIEINRTEKFPQIASFKLELIEPADNPDTLLEKGPFTMPAIFYKNVTLSYTIPNSPFMQSGLYGFKATFTEPTLGTVLASDETYFYINDTITPAVQGII